jgi:hypothetical protein
MKPFKSYLSEGRPSQRHPLEGHEYHKKTDAELKYIAKDAHEAAEAMKSHNTAAENKYRDQANDSATVRYWRQKHGMPDWYKKTAKSGVVETDVFGIKAYHSKCLEPGCKFESKRFSSMKKAQEAAKKHAEKEHFVKEEVEQIDELSTELLGRYKKAAGASASAADKAGDFEKGNKRFAGINKATLKQFKNAVKKEEVELEEDWQKVNKSDRTDGLSQKAVDAYRRENPGSKLQTAVTEKNPKGKRAARRKSFCSRMSGMKKRLTNPENARDPDSPINKALRRWNC